MSEAEILSLRLRKLPHCDISVQPDASGNIRYVIRSGNDYVRLSEPFYRLLDGMDGSTCLRQLSRRVFDDVPPDSDSLTEFIAVLYRNGLIKSNTERDQNVLNQLSNCDATGGVSLFARIGQKMVKSKISFSNADRYTTLAYRYIGKYLLSRVGLVLITLISILGTSYFAAEISGLVNSWSFEDLFLFGNSYLLGVAGALTAGGATVFIHEAAHALTCKHFGRRVSGFGLMLYYGAPACFTDTTDCWALPKWQRLAVDAAGIIANLFLGSLSILLLPVVTSLIVYQFCIICAFANFFAAAVNVIPFLKLDGYFILSDWLDMPNLREDAIGIALNVRSLVGLIRSRRAYFRSILVLLFGVGSIAYGGAVMASGIYAVYMLVRLLVPSPKGTYLVLLLVGVPVFSVASYAISQARKIRARKPAGILSLPLFKESGQL